jgi:hypothetical protein
VGFLGGFEQERYETVLGLAKAGIQVTVRGPSWERYAHHSHPDLNIRPGWVGGDDYARSICATKINLCFLRKIVGDLHTARSIEIPACRAFMLAERTSEHLVLFEEGKEAEFFGSEGELLAKVRYYLEHDEERLRIAVNGYERCVRSGYSYAERLEQVLDCISGIS